MRIHPKGGQGCGISGQGVEREVTSTRQNSKAKDHTGDLRERTKKLDPAEGGKITKLNFIKLARGHVISDGPMGW